MKSKYPILLAMLAMTSLLAAQTGPEPAAPAQQAVAASAPTENVTLNVKGTLSSGLPVDLTFTMSGPEFSMDQQLAEIEINGRKQPILGVCQITLAALANGYRVQYTIGAKVPVVSSSTVQMGRDAGEAASAASSTGRGSTSPRVTSTVTYQNISVSGAVILKPGQPVTILSSGGKDLAITLVKTTP